MGDTILSVEVFGAEDLMKSQSERLSGWNAILDR
jgi:hypothetical protein